VIENIQISLPGYFAGIVTRIFFNIQVMIPGHFKKKYISFGKYLGSLPRGFFNIRVTIPGDLKNKPKEKLNLWVTIPDS